MFLVGVSSALMDGGTMLSEGTVHWGQIAGEAGTLVLECLRVTTMAVIISRVYIGSELAGQDSPA